MARVHALGYRQHRLAELDGREGQKRPSFLFKAPPSPAGRVPRATRRGPHRPPPPAGPRGAARPGSSLWGGTRRRLLAAPDPASRGRGIAMPRAWWMSPNRVRVPGQGSFAAVSSRLLSRARLRSRAMRAKPHLGALRSPGPEPGPSRYRASSLCRRGPTPPLPSAFGRTRNGDIAGIPTARPRGKACFRRPGRPPRSCQTRPSAYAQRKLRGARPKAARVARPSSLGVVTRRRGRRSPAHPSASASPVLPQHRARPAECRTADRTSPRICAFDRRLERFEPGGMGTASGRGRSAGAAPRQKSQRERQRTAGQPHRGPQRRRIRRRRVRSSPQSRGLNDGARRVPREPSDPARD
jgi:hypothetical protein